jgi:hypothetical protein
MWANLFGPSYPPLGVNPLRVACRDAHYARKSHPGSEGRLQNDFGLESTLMQRRHLIFPVVNIVLLYFLGFSDWPILKELKALRTSP